MALPNDRLVELLQAKRREDPDGFREYLPDVDELLPDRPSSRSSRARYRLTVQERAHHHDGLTGALERANAGVLSSGEAAQALQHCANLLRDDPWTPDVKYEAVIGLLKAALGKSPGSYKSNATLPVSGADGGPAIDQVPAIRGVHLDLDREGRLVSISINPRKYRERRKLMAIVGVGGDPETDVAAKHDDYIAMQDPHGAA